MNNIHRINRQTHKYCIYINLKPHSMPRMTLKAATLFKEVRLIACLSETEEVKQQLNKNITKSIGIHRLWRRLKAAAAPSAVLTALKAFLGPLVRLAALPARAGLCESKQKIVTIPTLPPFTEPALLVMLWATTITTTTKTACGAPFRPPPRPQCPRASSQLEQ